MSLLQMLFGDPGAAQGRRFAPAQAAPPVLNEALVRRTLAFLEANPHRWNQRRYATLEGTGCFGGWALALYQGIALERVYVMSNLRVELGAQVALGFTERQVQHIFGYACLTRHDRSGLDCVHPTFQQLCDRVYEETGIRYEPTPTPPVADVAPARELVAA